MNSEEEQERQRKEQIAVLEAALTASDSDQLSATLRAKLVEVAELGRIDENVSKVQAGDQIRIVKELLLGTSSLLKVKGREGTVERLSHCGEIVVHLPADEGQKEFFGLFCWPHEVEVIQEEMPESD